MEKEVVNLFWTGGWDSTFRLLQLLLIEKKAVQPFYIIDSDRLSTRIEINTMKKITELLRKKFPQTKKLLSSKIFRELSDIKPDKKISQQYKNIATKQFLGSQYEWMARFAKELKITNIEVCTLKNGRIYKLLSYDIQRTADQKNYQMKKDLNNPDLEFFKYFRFSTFNLTKLDMGKVAVENSFADLMKLTWFCHRPTKKRLPCGTCNPCKYAIKDGMGSRIPLKGRIKYYLGLS